MVRREFLQLGIGVLGAAAAFDALAAASDDEAKLHAQARKEGKVVWWTAHYALSAAEAVRDAFVAKYPGIEVEFIRQTAQVVYQRLSQNLKAHVREVDVFAILLRHRGDRQLRVGEVHPLARRDRTAVEHARCDFRLIDSRDHSLDKTVVDQDAVAAVPCRERIRDHRPAVAVCVDEIVASQRSESVVRIEPELEGGCEGGVTARRFGCCEPLQDPAIELAFSWRQSTHTPLPLAFRADLGQLESCDDSVIWNRLHSYDRSRDPKRSRLPSGSLCEPSRLP